jgi:hypothetical protein
MDELRDYRFYDADMVHLSETAEEYIFERMAETYCDATMRENMRKVEKFLKSARHRISDASTPAAVEFARNALRRLRNWNRKSPGLTSSRNANASWLLKKMPGRSRTCQYQKDVLAK